MGDGCWRAATREASTFALPDRELQADETVKADGPLTEVSHETHDHGLCALDHSFVSGRPAEKRAQENHSLSSAARRHIGPSPVEEALAAGEDRQELAFADHIAGRETVDD